MHTHSPQRGGGQTGRASDRWGERARGRNRCGDGRPLRGRPRSGGGERARRGRGARIPPDASPKPWRASWARDRSRCARWDERGDEGSARTRAAILAPVMGVTGVLGEQPAPDQTETRGAQLSVVVPVFNERDGLRELYAEIESACDSIGLAWELIFVDDGSTDGTAELLRASSRPSATRSRVVRLRRNFGKSAALRGGLRRRRAEQTVVTLDGDGQDDPAEIPALVRRLGEGYELVSGWKRERHDPPLRRWASHLFNVVTARLSGVQTARLQLRPEGVRRGMRALAADLRRAASVHPGARRPAGLARDGASRQPPSAPRTGARSSASSATPGGRSICSRSCSSAATSTARCICSGAWASR